MSLQLAILVQSMKAVLQVALFLILFPVLAANASDQGLSPQFHIGRRAEFRKAMPDSSVAIFLSAPVRNRANDVDYVYHQDPDFYYLTGIVQADALLMIFKNTISIDGVSGNEWLFVHDIDSTKELWTGKMINAKTAAAVSGVVRSQYSSSLYSFPAKDILSSILMVKKHAGVTDNKNDTLDLFNLYRLLKERFNYNDTLGSVFIKQTMAVLREVKEPEEMALLRKAISISVDGHMEMMKYTHPKLSEYSAQAAGEFVFRSEGAEDVGYPSICGAGENGCTLHYITNRKELDKNELLLLDMGAEYKGYTADITRTIPVGGKFSPEQKIIYDLVYDAQEASFRMCAPGNPFKSPHNASVEVIKKGLMELGIITVEADYKKYFPHGTSHYLGLDVHDPGTRNPLKPGNVITVEPGIYIPPNSPCDPKWWGIGVRIEDDILITSDGYEILSSRCPRKSAEIEALMKERSFLEK